MEIYYLKNKETNKEYTLDKYAALFTSLVYSDIECIAKSLDGEQYYLLDECGNWDYIDLNKWKVVSVDEMEYRRKKLME